MDFHSLWWHHSVKLKEKDADQVVYGKCRLVRCTCVTEMFIRRQAAAGLGWLSSALHQQSCRSFYLLIPVRTLLTHLSQTRGSSSSQIWMTLFSTETRLNRQTVNNNIMSQRQRRRVARRPELQRVEDLNLASLTASLWAWNIFTLFMLDCQYFT